MTGVNRRENRVIIFDFDDTLIKTTEIFDEVRAQFCQALEDLGLAVPGLPDLVDERDIENIQKAGGFYNHCFPEALRQVYHHCCQQHCQPVSAELEQKLEKLNTQNRLGITTALSA